MIALIFLALNLLATLLKSKSRLEAENAALRQQLIVLQRKLRGRVRFSNDDRLFFVQPYRWFPSILEAMLIIRPETLVRWHRAGFRGYLHDRHPILHWAARDQWICGGISHPPGGLSL